MAATAFNSGKAAEAPYPEGQGVPAPAAGGPQAADPFVALQVELRETRVEFIALRKLMLERETAGKALIEGYRGIIAEFTDLFETIRNENIEREETLRFFLSSIEGRIKADVHNQLVASKAVKRSWWSRRGSR